MSSFALCEGSGNRGIKQLLLAGGSKLRSYRNLIRRMSDVISGSDEVNSLLLDVKRIPFDNKLVTLDSMR